jgi:hypothetical protein
MTATLAPSPDALPAVPPAVSIALARAGWEIVAVEIDLAARRFMLEARRADGRWIHVAASQQGRPTIERWQRSREWYRASRRAASYERSFDTFLGRDFYEHPLHALKFAAHYLADNPAPGCEALTHLDARNAIRLLLSGQGDD